MSTYVVSEMSVYIVTGAGSAEQAIEWVQDESASAVHSAITATPFGTPHDAEEDRDQPGFCLCGQSMTKAMPGVHT